MLVVSFDKTLMESLKDALSGHDVHIAKNTEEAIKMMPSDIEGVIYDAISGAISEEDINTLYTKKFSNARYVILYDELFPVDAENIIVPQKILVPRDEDPKEIVRKLEEFPIEPQVEEEEVPGPLAVEADAETAEFEVEPTSLEHTPAEESLEELSGSVESALEEIASLERAEPEEEAEEESVEESVEESAVTEEVSEETEAPARAPGRSILIVSFDQTLIDSLLSVFEGYEVRSVKTVKQAMDEGRSADIIIFDAISGVIAEKGLIDMASDPELSRKLYLILVDDLFPINVDGIPLERKIAVSRDTDPARLKELLTEQESAVPEPPVQTESAEPGEGPVPSAGEETVAEESVEESAFQEVPEDSVPEIEITPAQTEIPEIEVEEEAQEEEIPALTALEKIIEEQKLREEAGQEEQPPATQEETASAPPQIHIPQEEISRLVESAVANALSEEKIREILSAVLEEKVSDLRDALGEAIRGEIERAFEELDIRNLIRQATYQALKERLEELIS